MKRPGKNYLIVVSVLLWIYFVVSSVILTPVMILIWLLTVIPDKNLRILHKFSCFWGAQYIWINPIWSLRISDRKKFDDRKTYVMMSNHQSLADILVIYSLFKHFRWTSKIENFKLPFVGWVLTFNRSVKIFRGAGDAYRKFIKQTKKALEQNNSVMIFPEGTRSKDGNMGRFKEGSFKLAHEMKIDILPLVLDGTSKAIPKSGWKLTGRERMMLKVLDPLPYEQFRDLTPAQTADMVHEIIYKALKDYRSKNYSGDLSSS